jgi:hypothetical protein
MSYKLYRDARWFTLTGPRSHAEGDGVYGHVEQVGDEWCATGPWGPQPGVEDTPRGMSDYGALLFGLVRSSISVDAVEPQDDASRSLLAAAKMHTVSAKFADAVGRARRAKW